MTGEGAGPTNDLLKKSVGPTPSSVGRCEMMYQYRRKVINKAAKYQGLLKPSKMLRKI